MKNVRNFFYKEKWAFFYMALGLIPTIFGVWGAGDNKLYVISVLSISFLGFTFILFLVRDLRDDKSLLRDRKSAYNFLSETEILFTVFDRIRKFEDEVNINLKKSSSISKEIDRCERELADVCNQIIRVISECSHKKTKLTASIFLIQADYNSFEIKPFKYTTDTLKSIQKRNLMDISEIANLDYPIDENTDFEDICVKISSRENNKFFCCNDIRRLREFKDSNFYYIHNEDKSYRYFRGKRFIGNFKSLITVPIYNLNDELSNTNKIKGFLSVDCQNANTFTKAERNVIQLIASQLYRSCEKIMLLFEEISKKEKNGEI